MVHTNHKQKIGYAFRMTVSSELTGFQDVIEVGQVIKLHSERIPYFLLGIEFRAGRKYVSLHTHTQHIISPTIHSQFKHHTQKKKSFFFFLIYNRYYLKVIQLEEKTTATVLLQMP